MEGHGKGEYQNLNQSINQSINILLYVCSQQCDIRPTSEPDQTCIHYGGVPEPGTSVCTQGRVKGVYWNLDQSINILCLFTAR